MRSLGIVSLILAFSLASSPVAPAQPPETAIPAKVSLVIDGDTVMLDNGEYVRYLGIDTPEEGEEFYWAAKSYNRRLVWRREVYLEIGPEERDGYGRLLAYVWVEREGEWLLVNEELLRKVLAKLLVIWPDHYYKRLLKAITLAQVEKRGLWGKYKEPLALEAIERDPLQYVGQAVTVVFTVSTVEMKREGLYVYAMYSRYGFHVVVREDVLDSVAVSNAVSKGRRVEVTGELRWDNFLKGPYIEVVIPEQWGSAGE